MLRRGSRPQPRLRSWLGSRRKLALDLRPELDRQRGVIEDHRELGLAPPVSRPAVPVTGPLALRPGRRQLVISLLDLIEPRGGVGRRVHVRWYLRLSRRRACAI
jgi:hypothetical protein